LFENDDFLVDVVEL